MTNSKIHSTAIVMPGAQLGRDVSIGPFTTIHANVVLGDESRIGSHCILGEPTPLADEKPLVIGPGALVRSHSVFYQGSSFGPRLVTGHAVTVREKTVAGENLQVGTRSDFQGWMNIGDHVRTHSNVFLAQHATIGSFVWILPHSVLTDDPHPPSEVRQGVTIEEFAVISAASTVLPGVRIGTASVVAAKSLVVRDVRPRTVVMGVPAKEVGPTWKVMLRDGSGAPAYPWTRHFSRGYPEEWVSKWRSEHREPKV